jgi:hypothetical protein
MNLEKALHDLDQALHDPQPRQEQRLQAARQLLVDAGSEILGMEASRPLSLAGIIRLMLDAPREPDRRSFALLLVHALGVAGLVRPRSGRANFDRDLCAYLEDALPSALHRSGYPFNNPIYDRVRFLEDLHAAIDLHLEPLDPTFPPWLSGFGTYKKC